MPTLSSLQLPPPKNWQDFEIFCCDLWRVIWRDPNTQRNGRQGQAQHGVDVFGRRNQGSTWAGVQCKGKDNYSDQNLTEKELRCEVEKATGFHRTLAEYTIATTAPRDATIQRIAGEITDQHKVSGLFSVHVWSWDDILESLEFFPDVVAKHYPQFRQARITVYSQIVTTDGTDTHAPVLDRDALYYPNIRIENVDWLKATLLCFPQVRRIVPGGIEPNDTDQLRQFAATHGARGPLLVNVTPDSEESLAEQRRLARRIQEHVEFLKKHYSRDASQLAILHEQDLYRIFYLKVDEELRDVLLGNSLAWPSPTDNGCFLLHSKLGKAVMATIAVAIANENGLDIVTDDESAYRAVFTQNQEDVFDELVGALRSRSSSPSQELTDELAEVFIQTYFDVSKLSIEQIVELQGNGLDLMRFKKEIAHVARSIPDIRNPTEREGRLRLAAERIKHEWEEYRHSLPQNVRDAIVDDKEIDVGFRVHAGVVIGKTPPNNMCGSRFQYLNRIAGAVARLTVPTSAQITSRERVQASRMTEAEYIQRHSLKALGRILDAQRWLDEVAAQIGRTRPGGRLARQGWGMLNSARTRLDLVSLAFRSGPPGRPVRLNTIHLDQIARRVRYIAGEKRICVEVEADSQRDFDTSLARLYVSTDALAAIFALLADYLVELADDGSRPCEASMRFRCTHTDALVQIELSCSGVRVPDRVALNSFLRGQSVFGPFLVIEGHRAISSVVYANRLVEMVGGDVEYLPDERNARFVVTFHIRRGPV